MTPVREAIRAIYRQVDAPDWAAPNLDALADVLRDLSWLPPGPVSIVLPDLAFLAEDERRSLLLALARTVDETVDGDRPVRVRPAI